MILKITTTVLFVFLLHTSCKDKQKPAAKEEERPRTVQVTPYDFSHPDKRWVLSDSLFEISGIAWLGENRLLAIEDIRPILYEIGLGDTAGRISNRIIFLDGDKEKYDFEDLEVSGDTVYALRSHGAVFKILNWNKKKIKVQKSKTWLTKENNTEGMAYDPVSGNLLIACKDASGLEDEKKSTRSVFEFDMKADSLKAEPYMLIYSRDFKALTGEKIDFYPSAIAVHPITHDIYVLSTKDTKCVAEFDHGGKLKAFQYLDKNLMQQPEGLCFDPKGNLFVSTEGKNGLPAYIYLFSEQRK